MITSPYAFADQTLFERVTQLGGSYAQTHREHDIPVQSRIAKRTLHPSHSCPFSSDHLIKLQELEQGTEQWRNARNSFISSSRFGVAIGEWPPAWGTPMEFWRESTGRIPPRKYGDPALAFMAHGTHYEPVARSVYNRIVGKVEGIAPLEEEGMRVELNDPFVFSASPDGVGPDRLIEIKCRAIGSLYEHPPYYYLPQIAGAMAIYNRPFSDFVGYWAREDMIPRLTYCCRIHHSDEYWRVLRLRLTYMAWCMVTDTPPTGSPILASLYPLPALEQQDYFLYEGEAWCDDDPSLPLSGI